MCRGRSALFRSENVIRELVDLLYPSLLEMNQTVYADIIKQQIDRALQDAAAGYRQAGKRWPGR